MSYKCGRGARDGRRRRAGASARFTLALAAFALFASPAQAQAPESDYSRQGYKLGGFRLHNSITIDNFYNDNVFATDGNKDDDYFVSIVPGLEIESTWLHHYLSLNAFGTIDRYATVTAEDNEEYTVETQGRLDLTEESSLTTVFRQGRDTVGRTNAENDRRKNPQQLYFYAGELSYDHGFSKIDLTLRGFARRLDYVKSIDDDRDRVHYGGRPRLAYRFSPAFSVFLEPGAEIRDYDDKRDNDGVEKSSAAISGYVGSEFDITSIIRGELAIGFIHINFDESSFDDETIPAVKSEVTWDVTPLTRLDLEVAHRLATTTRQGASSKTQTLVSLGASHELRRNVILNAQATYLREDFNDISRDDDNFRFRAGARYLINRFLSIDLGYRFRLRETNAPNRDFRQNVVTLSIEGGL